MKPPTKPTATSSDEPPGGKGKSGSGITSIGQQLIQNLRNMEVMVIQNDPEVNAYLLRQNAKS
jgi:molybdenum-dependent DNA-binding transcriptional regulator ModE